jgi:hypothetical protein
MSQTSNQHTSSLSAHLQLMSSALRMRFVHPCASWALRVRQTPSSTDSGFTVDRTASPLVSAVALVLFVATILCWADIVDAWLKQ